VTVAFCAFAVSAPAQTFKLLKSFNGTNGAGPYFALAEGTDGNLYGTTVGNYPITPTAFRVSTSGALHTIYRFSSGAPLGGLYLADTGYFFGVTQFQGQYDLGTIFELEPNGKYVLMYSFCPLGGNCPDGEQPESGVIQGNDLYWYGTASLGGSALAGTAFKYDVASLTVLYDFCSLSNCYDGKYPGGLVVGLDGNYYGTAWQGGAGDGGTVYQLTPSGAFTLLYPFCIFPNCSDGAYPNSLMLGADGNFYGTTSNGGTGGSPCSGGCGTIFRVTPEGGMTTLHSFSSAEGSGPVGLVQGTDGNFYGATEGGGKDSDGTLFQMTPSGTFTMLHSFSGTNGAAPHGPMMQATDGNFYGTCTSGGKDNDGTIYKLSMGLSPFVKLMTRANTIGSGIGIIGNNLTGATAVTFNGVPSTEFIVYSPTQMNAVVPSGATTGPVVVTTPNGVLQSNVDFQVLP
jgi:uncharacterized repeat protein (TIGR03803 family)